MMLSIWNKTTKKWKTIHNAKMVSLHDAEYIEIDYINGHNEKYQTKNYSIQFIHGD